MTATFNREKCQQRNRIAARHGEVNAAPFTFLRNAPPAAQSAGLRYAHGTLPATPEAALGRINVLLPPDAPPLTLDAIYLHYVEAANGNYIGERDARPMFMGDTTLRNIATDATAGVAFMNSHRDGGLSHPADLPMGRTFAGRYEEYQNGTRRAVVGFYMVAGTAPNGAQGPTTDDLHTGIQAGTVFDVSVGLGGGERVCDICGKEVNATRDETDADGYTRRVPACPHVPGTTRKLSKEQQAAQRARGVKTGVATYTLHNAHCGEVSAVYDGAVPGAGFAKALRLARDLSPAERLQVRAAYGPLLRKGDLPMDEISDAIADGFNRAMAKMGLRPESDPPPTPAPVPAPAPTPTPPTPPPPANPEVFALQARLAQVEGERRAEQAATFAAGLVQAGRVLPAARPALEALYAQALADDAAHAATVTFSDPVGQAQTLTRAATLAAFCAALPAAPFGQERIPAGSFALPAQPAPDADAAAKRLAALLNMTPMGQVAQHTNGKEH